MLRAVRQPVDFPASMDVKNATLVRAVASGHRGNVADAMLPMLCHRGRDQVSTRTCGRWRQSGHNLFRFKWPSFKTTLRANLAALIVMIIDVSSCMHPRASIPNAPIQISSPDWIDLQPGWRVRVVTPMLRSGGYLIKAGAARAGGGDRAHQDFTLSRNNTLHTVTSANTDLIGYEISFYSVKSRRGGGVRVVFHSAEIIREGQRISSRHPIEPMFQLPRQATWLRIVHWSRGSHDYDAAILAANRQDLLPPLTRQLQSDPFACKISGNTFCSWIHPGVAVMPESRSGDKGKKEWVPVM
jgi:hypothetical protein